MVINKKSMENEVLLGDAILQRDIPGIDSGPDTKLRWLRSQIIGRVALVHTPFGIRKLTYADHTASGRCLQYIEEYIIQTVLPFYGNTHTSDSYVGYRTTKVVHDATEYVKKCLGGTQDDALFFCGSGTTAAIKKLQEVMGVAIPSILKEKVLKSCLRNEERWVVFVGPYEHHSNLLSWRQSLAEVIEIGLDKDGMIDMDDLKCQLQFYQGTGRPMLGSFSACSNVTGICSDTRSLSSLLHEFGAFACFDFAASGPYVEIDMRSGAIDGYDAIILSPHKFLGGPGSPRILLMNKILYQLKNAPPSTCGGGTVNYVNYFDEQDTLYINDIEEREDAGTPQIIQRVKVALAFQVKEYIGGRVIEEKENEYVGKALERLTRNKNIWVLGNTKVVRQAIISFLIHSTSSSPDAGNKVDEEIHISSETCYKRDKPLDGAFVAKLLNDLFGIQARGGCACAGPYGHHLLGIDKPLSLAIKSAIEMGD
uniref:probable cysteine desulfurase n=1 Tax=Erigeron canadensis TaxID=72917 RepID=UPI001CB932E5|nr:probable cysteine desulfurase [Erigeron canadensis]